jgi:hypothetical protein
MGTQTDRDVSESKTVRLTRELRDEIRAAIDKRARTRAQSERNMKMEQGTNTRSKWTFRDSRYRTPPQHPPGVIDGMTCPTPLSPQSIYAGERCNAPIKRNGYCGVHAHHHKNSRSSSEHQADAA